MFRIERLGLGNVVACWLRVSLGRSITNSANLGLRERSCYSPTLTPGYILSSLRDFSFQLVANKS